MQTVNKCIAQGAGLAKVLVQRAATLHLGWDMRQKSRFSATDSTGQPWAMVLPRGQVLRGGDVLVAENGTLLQVVAAPQHLLRVTATSQWLLLRAAYHLGNRHTPVEIQPDYLHIEYDAVLEAMLQHLGVQVQAVQAPFEPEHGAYGGGHRHGHDASFAQDYALAQEVYALHDHDHGHHHHHAHSHGSGCNHTHSHD